MYMIQNAFIFITKDVTVFKYVHIHVLVWYKSMGSMDQSETEHSVHPKSFEKNGLSQYQLLNLITRNAYL
jgi:hypothetical protein